MTATASISKILVAIDGSARSVQTVRYLADLPGLRDAEVHLLNVFTGIPENFYDIEKESSGMKITADMLAWQRDQRGAIEDCLKKCRKILLAADFHPQRIETIIHPRRLGVARDIAAAAADGYDALLLRRRGMNRLAGMIIGSVATKLLHNLCTLPLIFAGRNPHTHRLLIAVDLSENSLRAVDFAGRLAGRHGCTVGIVSVLRRGASRPKPGQPVTVSEPGSRDAEERILKRFETARARLIAAGVASAGIESEIIKDAYSRSSAIVNWARRNDYSTIVMGRKGVSEVDDCSLGGVADKIIHTGRSFHIWLAS